MKAPDSFKYSPNGYHVIEVAKDEEMNDAAIEAALKLELIKKADITAARRAKKETEGETAKATAPDANKATGPDANKATG